MPFKKNILIPGAGKLPVLLDIFFNNNLQQNPVVIYAHGFNGFKDWGNFDLIAEKFAAAGFTLVKFNFSHNGTTPEQPEDFANPEAFGNNNYSKQLADLKLVVDWVCDSLNNYQAAINKQKIYLMGHSMGGGIAILYAATDKRIKKLVTWAAISECKTPWGSWSTDKMKAWKETGVAWYQNNRTQQQMPIYYQLYEDFIQHAAMLDIKKAIGKLTIPILICHGKEDLAVLPANAYDLKKLQPAAGLFITAGDHVFGRKHPWTDKELPPETEALVTASLEFFKL